MKRPGISDWMRLRAAWLWGFLLTALVYCAIHYLIAEFGCWSTSLPAVRSLKTAADALLIMLPYWLLPARWRGMALLPVWGVTVVCLCDAVYGRFFSDCVPLSALFQAGNADGLVAGSVWANLRTADRLVAMCPLAATALWCVRPLRRAVEASPLPMARRAAMCVVSVAVFVAGQYAHNKSFIRSYHWEGIEIGHGRALKMRLSERDETFRVFHKSSLRQSGMVCHMVLELCDFISGEREIRLTAAEREAIDRFALKADEGCDSVVRRNVIFIVAESLNAEAIGRRAGGAAVTPVLDSLIAAEGTVSCLDMTVQVADGMSSDGQLMYNLGLLPLRGGAVRPEHVAGRRLPSLAAQLSATHSTTALFAERGITWHESKMYKAYGYGTIRTSDDTRRRVDFDAEGADRATMMYALELMDSLAEPVYLQMLTVSTHYPFRTPPGADSDNTDSGMSRRERDYLRCVHYLDSAIGLLADGLRRRGMLDNTMLVIASDHHMNMDGNIRPGRPAVFIAANTGHRRRVIGEMAQIDVFPTVCGLLGLRGRWRGLGRDVLNEAPAHGGYGRARAVSDSILRSDYFRSERVADGEVEGK